MHFLSLVCYCFFFVGNSAMVLFKQSGKDALDVSSPKEAGEKILENLKNEKLFSNMQSSPQGIHQPILTLSSSLLLSSLLFSFFYLGGSQVVYQVEAYIVFLSVSCFLVFSCSLSLSRSSCLFITSPSLCLSLLSILILFPRVSICLSPRGNDVPFFSLLCFLPTCACIYQPGNQTRRHPSVSPQ